MKSRSPCLIAAVLLLGGCARIATPWTVIDPPACDDPDLGVHADSLASTARTTLGLPEVRGRARLEDIRETGLLVSDTNWTAARVCEGRLVGDGLPALTVRWMRQEVHGGIILLPPWQSFRSWTGASCLVGVGTAPCDPAASFRPDRGTPRLLPLD